jgi:hypothetical protein
MARRKLSPSEILERLHAIDALVEDGQPMADAIRMAGVPQVDYDRWRLEYNGLLRTLGPLVGAPPKPAKRTRRGSPIGKA